MISTLPCYNENKFKDITFYLSIQMETNTNTNTNSQKIPKKFYCETCHYTTGKLSEWTKHTLTRKHINSTKNINTDTRVFECKKCNNSYKYNSGLSRHYKTCSPPQNIETTEQILIKENKELKELIVKQTTVNLKLLDYLQNKYDYQSVDTDVDKEFDKEQ